jgi:hypothetical protein
MRSPKITRTVQQYARTTAGILNLTSRCAAIDKRLLKYRLPAGERWLPCPKADSSQQDFVSEIRRLLLTISIHSVCREIPSAQNPIVVKPLIDDYQPSERIPLWRRSGYWANERDRNLNSKPKYRKIELSHNKLFFDYRHRLLCADSLRNGRGPFLMHNSEELPFKALDANYPRTGAGILSASQLRLLGFPQAERNRAGSGYVRA